MTNKFIPVVAVLALVISIFGLFRSPGTTGQSSFFGGAGGLLAENYIPYVNYNDGYTSENDISTSANLSFATTSETLMLNAGAGGSATTTIDLGKVCFRFTSNDANKTVIYYVPSSTSTGAGIAIGGWATSTASCM